MGLTILQIKLQGIAEMLDCSIILLFVEISVTELPLQKRRQWIQHPAFKLSAPP